MKNEKTKTDSIIREYIYLDNLEVNSILAQFEDGIPKVIEELKKDDRLIKPIAIYFE